MKRPVGNRVIAGVCAALANDIGFDVFFVRLLFFILLFTPFPILLVYILCWIFIASEI